MANILIASQYPSSVTLFSPYNKLYFIFPGHKFMLKYLFLSATFFHTFPGVLLTCRLLVVRYLLHLLLCVLLGFQLSYTLSVLRLPTMARSVISASYAAVFLILCKLPLTSLFLAFPGLPTWHFPLPHFACSPPPL